MSNAAMLLLSGGQDSATALLWALKRFDEIYALTFNYGQRHAVEVEYARRLADSFGIEHMVIGMAWIGPLLGSALGDHNLEISCEGGYQGLPTTFVPGRNMVLLSLAASIGAARGIYNIVAGMCETDFSGYPDCRRVFIDSFQDTFGLAINGQVTVHTPLMFLDKAKTFALADSLGGVDRIINGTMTCYEGMETLNVWGRGCGKCPACVLRAKGYDQWQSSLTVATT